MSISNRKAPGGTAARLAGIALAALIWTLPAAAQVAIKAQTLHTMGPAGTIQNGVIVITNGKIAFVGPGAGAVIPQGYRILEAAVATPGLVDARATVGLSGIYNQKQDSDQLEHSSPMQPELRAKDAYNPLEQLVAYVRSLGVTTVNTGHAPGELMSGQMIIVKTTGNTVEEALVKSPSAVAVTLSPAAQKAGDKSPGTRGKMMAMLREQLIKAQEYQAKWDRYTAKAEKGDKADKSDAEGKDKGPPTPPDRNLRLETLVSVLRGDLPLLVTANRAQDIDSVLRLKEEFKIKVLLDGATESYLRVDQIKAAGIPVVIHPSMQRAFGENENQSFETAAILHKAGIPVALQSGYESYVPKTRVVLFEAAIAAANGLSFQEALATITIDAAKILGIDQRVGSLENGKDGDVALYDGDPFEYTTHCTGVVIDGKVVSEIKR